MAIFVNSVGFWSSWISIEHCKWSNHFIYWFDYKHNNNILFVPAKCKKIFFKKINFLFFVNMAMNKRKKNNQQFCNILYR